MLDFELPLVRGKITIADALAETIESNKSGLLFELSPGDLRLVHFYSMLQAATSNQDLLESVVFEPVINIETVPATQLTTSVGNANRRFGFRGLQGAGVARLFSISELYAYPFTAVSPRRRCTRPGKPAGETPRNWFHYPPDNFDPKNPNNCKICGASFN